MDIRQFASRAEKRRVEREEAKKVLKKINEGLRLTFATEEELLKEKLDKDNSFIANPPEDSNE